MKIIGSHAGLLLTLALAGCGSSPPGDAADGACTSTTGADGGGGVAPGRGDGGIVDGGFSESPSDAEASVEGSTSTEAGGPPVETQATSYLVSPAHTGASADSALVPPLARLWSLDLGGAVSYPLIANGLVYVIVGPNVTSAGLMALDAKTGTKVWGPLDLGSRQGGFFAAHAYEGGKIFAINGSGTLQAFDAANGHPLWASQMPGQYGFSSAPTAYRGIVYVGGAGSGGTLYAVDEGSGNVLWTQPVENGDDSAPTVSDDGVFVSYACVQAYAFDRISGAPLWHHAGPCEGGGGATSVLFGGHLYARDFQGSLILDAKTGATAGTFSSFPAPSFDGNLGFFVSSGGIHASDVQTRASVWSFVGDGAIGMSPVIAAGTLYVGSGQGTLYALDAKTGTQLWSDAVGFPFVDATFVGDPLGQLGVGEGMLIAPAGTHLFAYTHADAGLDGGVSDGDADGRIDAE